MPKRRRSKFQPCSDESKEKKIKTKTGDVPIVENNACLQTFATFELAEAIFRFLGIRELFLAERVCKAWYNLIRSSSHLQESMFLRPKRIALASLKGSDAFELNPLLTSKFPLFFETRKEFNYRWGRKQLLLEPWNRSRRTRKAFAEPSASWRRMLVVQPPVPKVEVQQLNQTWGRHYKQTGEPTDPTSAMYMGWLYDYCSSVMLDDAATFVIHWHMCHDKDRWKPKLTVEMSHDMPSWWFFDYKSSEMRSKAFALRKIDWQTTEDLW